MAASKYDFKVDQGETFNPSLTYSLYARSFDDGGMALSDTTLTSNTANFTQGDVGRSVSIEGAGAARGFLNTTIASVTNSTTAVLAVASTFAVSSAKGSIYSPINLTSFSARMKVKDAAGNTLISLESGSGITLGTTNGSIDIVISAEDTAALFPGTHLYDLELESGAGIVTKLMKGSFIVNPEVTV